MTRRPARAGFVDVTTTCPPLLPDLPTSTGLSVGNASPAPSSLGDVTDGGAGSNVNDPSDGSGPCLSDVAAPDRSAPDAVPGSLPAGPSPRRGGFNP